MNLEREEYYEWMAAIEKMSRRKSEFELITEKMKVIDLQLKLSKLSEKSRLEDARLNVENAKSDYEGIKSRIEERLGMSLNGKMIDDVTFEVSDLPKGE